MTKQDVSPFVISNDESMSPKKTVIKTPGARLSLATSAMIQIAGGQTMPQVQLTAIPKKIDLWFECIEGEAYKGQKLHVVTTVSQKNEATAELETHITDENGEYLSDVALVQIHLNGGNDKLVGVVLTMEELAKVQELQKAQMETLQQLAQEGVVPGGEEETGQEASE